MLFLESRLTVSLGSMDVKVCLFLVLFGAVCCTARELAASDFIIIETEDVSGTSPILLLRVASDFCIMLGYDFS